MPVRKKTYTPKSCGKAIFSSKMFMSSPRQAKIRAAFEDAQNLELVRQLDEYLGDEYIALMKPPKNTDTPETKETEEQEINDTPAEQTESKAPRRESGSPIRPSLRDDYKDLEKDLGAEDSTEIPDGTAETSESSEASTESETVENSTKIKATTIIMHPEYEDAVNEIKGLLNANSTTAGVARVQKKDDEVWIYYKDSVNLNNLMDAVIDALTGGYLWLIFNRLARSENAIVFDILYDDTDKSIPNGNEK